MLSRSIPIVTVITTKSRAHASGAGLARGFRMKGLAVLFALASCTSSSSHATDAPPRGCPANGDRTMDCREVVDIGTSCPYPAVGSALAGSCACLENGFWVCNSCPFYWSPVDGCTPGTTCEINSWEHGCSCACTAKQVWDCSTDTINSHCPSAVDAGVD